MKIIRLALAAVLWIGLLAATRAAVDTHYVAQGGQTPVSAYTNWTTAASNIQDAIDVSANSDTVLVSNGMYQTGGITNYPSGSLLTNRVAITKAITVRSANNDPTNTIIKGAWHPVTTNGSAAVRCVYAAANSSLIGFMLTNGAVLASGSTGERRGGGVNCEASSTIISNCVMTGGAADRGGGAYQGTLYNCLIAYNRAGAGGGVDQSSAMYGCTLIGNSAWSEGGGVDLCPLINNCTIISNYGGGGAVYRCGIMYNCLIAYNYSGGGVYNDGSGYTPILSNCTIVGNSAGGSFGGTRGCILYNCTVVSNATPTDAGGGTRGGTNYNCLIAYNSATNSYGGGAYQCNLYNCTVVSNSAKNGGGVATCPEICNSIIYFNTSTDSGSNWYYVTSAGFTNSCTFPTPSGAGIIWTSGTTNDPQFANSANGNFRLSKSSPCVNTGTNFTWMTGSVDVRSKDLDGYRRLDKFSGRPDMGCYEYIPVFTIYNFH